MTKTRCSFHGYRFRAAIINCAMHWYHRFNLSLRDIDELLLERGVNVTYESVRNWCDRFGAQFAQCAKAVCLRPGTTWHLDEMFVKLRGEPYALWRAVDEQLDVLLQNERDKAAAKRFFRRILRSNPVPRKIVTDQLRSDPATKAGVRLPGPQPWNLLAQRFLNLIGNLPDTRQHRIAHSGEDRWHGRRCSACARASG